MFIYEKDGKLNIVFGNGIHTPVDNPDVILEKADGKIIVHVGDETIEGDPVVEEEEEEGEQE